MKVKVKRKQSNSKMCLICGMDNDAGVKAQFYEMEDDTVVSLFQFKEIHQSYPERTHGGMITCMLDEIIGRTMWLKDPDVYGVTTTIKVDFKKPVPYNTPLKGVGRIVRDTSRLFFAEGEIRDMDNNVLARAEGTYLKMPVEKIANANVREEMAYLIEDGITEIDL